MLTTRFSCLAPLNIWRPREHSVCHQTRTQEPAGWLSLVSNLRTKINDRRIHVCKEFNAFEWWIGEVSCKQRVTIFEFTYKLLTCSQIENFVNYFDFKVIIINERKGWLSLAIHTMLWSLILKKLITHWGQETQICITNQAILVQIMVCQIMVCHLFGAIPISVPILVYCWLDP